jgi:hypothetical protein
MITALMNTIQSAFRSTLNWGQERLLTDTYRETAYKTAQVALGALFHLSVLGASIGFSLYAIPFCIGICYGFTHPEKVQRLYSNIQEGWNQKCRTWGPVFKYSIIVISVPLFIWQFQNHAIYSSALFGAYLGQKWARLPDELQQRPRQISAITAWEQNHPWAKKAHEYAMFAFQVGIGILLFSIYPRIMILPFFAGGLFKERTKEIVDRMRALWDNRSTLFKRFPVSTSLFVFESGIILLPWTFLTASVLHTANLGRRFFTWWQDEEDPRTPINFYRSLSSIFLRGEQPAA